MIAAIYARRSTEQNGADERLHDPMRIVLLVIVGLFASVLLAQAPLPQALKTAKTAYLVNNGTKRDAFDRLAKELRTWGRFELVDDAKTVDITDHHQSHGWNGRRLPIDHHA